MLSHACTRRIPRGLSESSWISHPFLQPVACERREERGGRRQEEEDFGLLWEANSSIQQSRIASTCRRRTCRNAERRTPSQSPQKTHDRCAPRLGFGGKLAGGELHLSDRGKVDLPRRSREAERPSPLHSQSPPFWQERSVAWKAQGMKLSSLGISVMVARAMSSSARLVVRGTERQRDRGERGERERGVASNFPKNISEILILASLLL